MWNDGYSESLIIGITDKHQLFSPQIFHSTNVDPAELTQHKEESEPKHLKHYSNIPK